MTAKKKSSKTRDLKPKTVKGAKAASIKGGLGSQSSGAGAGKVTFNPFSITRKIDASSPTFF